MKTKTEAPTLDGVAPTTTGAYFPNFHEPYFSAPGSYARAGVVFDKPDDGGNGGKKKEEEEASEEDDEAENEDEEDSDDGENEEEPASEDDDDKLSDREAELLQETMKRKKDNKALKTELNEAKKANKAFEGIDPDEARAALKAVKDAEKAELEKAGEWDRLKEVMAEEHGKDLKLKDDRIAELEGVISEKDGIIDGLTVGQSFDNSAFIRDQMVLTPGKARVIFGDHFDVDGDTVVGFDKPRGASGRTPLVDGAGNPVGFETAMQRLVEADADSTSLLRSKMKPGAGSKTTGNKATEEPGDMAASEKIRKGVETLTKAA